MVSCCVYDKPPKIMQHMSGNIPYMFDCWADSSCSSPSTKEAPWFNVLVAPRRVIRLIER